MSAPPKYPSAAMVSWAGAQTWLQTTGSGDTQGFDSSSVAFLFLRILFAYIKIVSTFNNL